MQPVLWADLEAALRHLLALPQDARAAALGALLDQAAAAYAHHRATGRALGGWGSGTLMEVALQAPLAPRQPLDAQALACLVDLARGLAARL